MYLDPGVSNWVNKVYYTVAILVSVVINSRIALIPRKYNKTRFPIGRTRFSMRNKNLLTNQIIVFVTSRIEIQVRHCLGGLQEVALFMYYGSRLAR